MQTKTFTLRLAATSLMAMAVISFLVQCNGTKTETPAAADALAAAVKPDFHGFESKEKWGEHLVTVSGCHDCHSPKKMTAMGPVIDSSALLAGHIAGSPEPMVK
jgi:hypothetical protein